MISSHLLPPGSRPVFLPALRLGIYIILFTLILSYPALQAQSKQPKDDTGVYNFGVGDVLDIYVYEEPEISQEVVVRSDGRISLPLVGDVKAAGQTPEGLAARIAEKLAKYIDAPEVTVTLAESRENVYYILGQVEAPGEYIISRPVTVIQAIARAGGFLEWAKKSRIMIVSGPDRSESISYFDYGEFLDNPGKEENLLIKAGDTIVVP
ncbi:MAG: polysaccharide biosynthesis/export family protein [Desulfosalsimonadaceae bacterium]